MINHHLTLMGNARDTAIDIITSNLIMAQQLLPHEVACYMAYLQKLSDLDLAEAIVQSRQSLDYYYQTKWNLN